MSGRGQDGSVGSQLEHLVGRFHEVNRGQWDIRDLSALELHLSVVARDSNHVDKLASLDWFDTRARMGRPIIGIGVRDKFETTLRRLDGTFVLGGRMPASRRAM